MTEWVSETDVVVVGGGAGGLATAIVAAHEGLTVTVVEKTPWFGGTAAFSGGAIWIPGNGPARATGLVDSRESVMEYLDHTVGNRVPADVMAAYLDHGPAMVDYLERVSCVRFVPRAVAPDYLSELPGAAHGGRTLDTIDFDGRILGPWFEALRPPLSVLTLFGGMMVNRVDVDRLVETRRLASFGAIAHASKLIARYALDRVSHSRGTRLVLGNALAARLLKSAIDAEVTLLRNTPARRLLSENGRTVGLFVEHDGQERLIRARKGIVLASGGFGANQELRRQHLPDPTGAWSMAAEGNTGDGLTMAREVGGEMGGPNLNNAFWCPVSVLKESDGSLVRWPHLRMDRPKPGLIAVNSAAKRFVNESASYHHFVEAMIQSHGQTPCIPTFLVCDAWFLDRYGLGLVRPGGPGKSRLLKRGYLFEGATLEDLARQLKLDPSTLAETVRRYNDHARDGVDPDFGKGSTEFNRHYGDPDHTPNPCLRPIESPPFYAVLVYPGDIGTAHGIKVNSASQVLDREGRSIDGLYAVGNDMSSVVSGNYPGAGITIGPAMTFGYIAARHMAGTLGR
jgi:succinate dehydrogenase/fumarate reductase flavoprotein subunit